MSIFKINGQKQIFSQVTKKCDKQITKNYRPVSLLPICSKISEKIILNSLLE